MWTRRVVLSKDVCFILSFIFSTSRSEGDLSAFKSAAQSSNLFSNQWLASAAVDTCRNTLITSGCCTHTASPGPKTVWWRVDLGQISTITTIEIIYRANFQQRLAGYHLYVSNTTDSPTQGVLCFEDKSSTREAVSLGVIHSCPYVGRYVTIYNYRSTPKRYEWYENSAVLELCEVTVLGCATGFYGNGNCNEVCPGSCYGGNCNPITGSCLYCSPGKYGVVCDRNCSTNCKNSLCDKDSGSCFECYSGRHGDTCDQECSVNCKDRLCAKDTGFCTDCVNGKYGILCSLDCSVNCKDRLCAEDTGFCTDCVNGKYGLICSLDCSVNCKDRLCAKDTGYCTDCVAGRHGITCELECSITCKDMLCARDTGFCGECIAGKYRNTCDENCPMNCQDNVCTRDTGLCIGCVGGFYGTNCSIPCNTNCSECHQESGECTQCKLGLYGTSCNMSCGHCSSCQQVSGLCVTACDPGYQGSFCETKQAQRSEGNAPTTDVGAIVGPIAGVIAVLVIGIVIVIFIRRRRLSASKRDSFDDIRHHKDYDKKVYDQPLEQMNSRAGRDIPDKNVNNSIVPDDEPVEPPKDSANVYVNAEEVTMKSDTDENIYYNSGPIGFPVSELKSLVLTKMQNKSKAFENEYKSIPFGDLHEHKIGMLPQNKTKNRFKTTFPYDHSRVVLDSVGKDPHSDYINANYIDSVTKTAEYVATQGPRPGTVNDFWRMVWQLKTNKIVMLTNLIEGAKHKCDKYWPDEGQPLSTTHFNIILDRERSYAFYVIRDLTVTEKKTKSARQIHQFHYITWPDHGTPDPNELVVFHRRVKQYQNVLTGKLVVHCSAGIGRTGTFLALDALLDYGKEFGRIDVMQYVNTMRKDRINMVQTADQYIAIHQLLVEAFDMPDALIPRMKYHATLNSLVNGGPTNQTKLRKEYELTQVMKPKYDDTDCKAALLPINKTKNKTLSVLAVDKFRAYLLSQASNRTDYINAVEVPSYTSKTGYIVTQTPMEDTVVDLLTMIMDHDCTTIVIIDTDTIDWLPEQGEGKVIGDYQLENKGKSSTISNTDMLEITITDQSSELSTNIRVFHLSGWNQESPVPQDSSTLLQLLELVDSRRKSDDTKTTVVMCRDGYTQSGLFCCISSARDQMKIDDEVDIFQISRQLLTRRPEFIISFEQYHCCYNVIRDYLDATDVYMN
ncbi:receptor-type tyrosine-protein phosphatase kappa-like [Ylistrum balloti]|uniref:receptor-type tyrosine-protein phosphatase kappa-like n=1 Tax=Ylistrum balloti TaxID=509963 RepID=UPI00290599A1|nr:receptor-type tyrosine-protein phosphatase kappa-like [Ylistrum balloti]